jgi:hypothetical protein
MAALASSYFPIRRKVAADISHKSESSRFSLGVLTEGVEVGPGGGGVGAGLGADGPMYDPRGDITRGRECIEDA